MEVQLFQESLVHLKKVGGGCQSQESSMDYVTEWYLFTGRVRNFEVPQWNMRVVTWYIVPTEYQH